RRRSCTTRATPPGEIRPATWWPITAAPTLSWPIGIRDGGSRRCGGRSGAPSPCGPTWRSAIPVANRHEFAPAKNVRRETRRETLTWGQHGESGTGGCGRSGGRSGHPAAPVDAVGAQTDAAHGGAAVPHPPVVADRRGRYRARGAGHLVQGARVRSR